MLEILAIWGLCKLVGNKVSEKGRNPLPYQILTAVAWIGGEIAGAIISAVVMAIAGVNMADGVPIPVYLGAIAGAVCCAGVMVLIAFVVPENADLA